MAVKRRATDTGGAGGNARARSHKTKAALEREKQERERELLAFRNKCRVASAVIFAYSVLYMLLLVFDGLAPAVNDVIHGLFGLSAYVWMLINFFVAVFLALESPERQIKTKIVLFCVCGFMLSTFIHLVSPVCEKVASGKMSIQLAIETMYIGGSNVSGSGVLGGAFAALMTAIFGRTLSIILLLLAAFVLVMLITGSDIVKLSKAVAKPVKKASVKAVEKVERAAEIHRVSKEERRRNAAFVDVPIDDEEYDEPQEEEPDIAAQEIYEEPQEETEDEELTPLEEIRRGVRKRGSRGDKHKTEEIRRTAEEGDADDDIDEEEYEQLLLKVSGEGGKKKQRQVELAKEVIAFAKEIKQQEHKNDSYAFPSTGLLIQCETAEDDTKLDRKINGDRLVATLREYGVEASVIGTNRGPAVTRYELQPAPGVKISRITNLNRDIALRLAAKAVRIEAPIPGKAAVGIEIPNQTLNIVRIRELLESADFHDAKSPITVAIGKDIEGNYVFIDLAKMPHLLIAGATGMGKSVCINSMLMSIIYKSSPQDVRLIMVDPKSVELDVYNGLPHLLVPVVCDPKKAAGALQWAVGEMEKRYAMLREQGVRNIDGYNRLAEKNGEFERMSRIVIIIDEMADLMMTSPKEVENTISRLAAMARAAGMHMVLATQRPSVDIITGTIKANVPSRIAFAVSSGVDSKIILDEGGAEELIGKGDMLLHPVGMPKPKRVQGCFVDDNEVDKVVSFIKSRCASDYDEEIAKEIERNAAGADEIKGDAADGFGENDSLFLKAIDMVTEAGQASTSMLQRRLGVGYARAGRLIDQLEEAGVIGPFEGSKPRQVIMSRAQYLEMAAMRENTAAVSEQQPVKQEGGSYIKPEELELRAVDIDSIPAVESDPEQEESVVKVEAHTSDIPVLGELLESLPTISIDEEEDDDEDVPF